MEDDPDSVKTNTVIENPPMKWKVMFNDKK
jgi:hypothetical protein